MLHGSRAHCDVATATNPAFSQSLGLLLGRYLRLLRSLPCTPCSGGRGHLLVVECARADPTIRELEANREISATHPSALRDLTRLLFDSLQLADALSSFYSLPASFFLHGGVGAQSCYLIRSSHVGGPHLDCTNPLVNAFVDINIPTSQRLAFP